MNTVTLTREEHETLGWFSLESSNLQRAAFSLPDFRCANEQAVRPGPRCAKECEHCRTLRRRTPEFGLLYVQFAGGRTYRYADVPRNALSHVLDSDSPGSYLNAEIKPVYKCERVQVSG